MGGSIVCKAHRKFWVDENVLYFNLVGNSMSIYTY